MSLIQSLEARRLMAVTPDPVAPIVKLSHTGTLQVTGTSGKDKIDLTRDSSTGAIVVKIPSAPSVNQDSYGVLSTGGFDPKLIKRIKIDGGGNGDVIDYYVTGKFVTTTINGGKGDDRISTFGTNTIINGGSGDDTLRSQQGTIFFVDANGTRSIATTTIGAGSVYQFNGDLRGQSFYTRTFDGKTGTVDVTANNRVISTNFRGRITNTQLISNGGAATYWQASDGGLDFVSPVGGSVTLNASGNRLDGGDGDDTFITSGTEDTIVGGNGHDSFTAPAAGIDVYNVDLAPIAVSKDILTIRSRLSAIGVEDITTNVDKTKGSVTVKAASLADLT